MDRDEAYEAGWDAYWAAHHSGHGVRVVPRTVWVDAEGHGDAMAAKAWYRGWDAAADQAAEEVLRSGQG